MKRFGRTIWILITVICLAGQTNSVLAAQDNATLSSYYYSGDAGRKPTVKNQGTYGTCWAITATSALECALLPKQRFNFSADHITHQSAFTADVDDGGDYRMLMAYLCGWMGPVTEEEDPYGDEYSPESLSPAVHVQEVRILPGADRDRIKEAVVTFGSVQTSLFMDRDTAQESAGYYRSDTAAYYYPYPSKEDHDVLILGWDDTYPAENFATEPDRDGAFICLNTWGDTFGEDGIFYVSYEDPNIASTCVAYTRVEETGNYDHLYQYDECGWVGLQGYHSNECWFSNVFTAGGDELLAAVGFYATDAENCYEIYLVHDFDGEASFDRMEFLQSGSFEDPGFYTVDLEQEPSLNEGERFAVVVKITASAEVNPVAVEFSADEFTKNVTTEGKESYLSRYGTYWEDTQEKFGTNVCLKAYTKNH